MEKVWLIRTKNNHLLGPVSKEKVIELYQNGSIRLDDEICPGNGIWFFIREENLLQKYLFGNSKDTDEAFTEASTRNNISVEQINVNLSLSALKEEQVPEQVTKESVSTTIVNSPRPRVKKKIIRVANPHPTKDYNVNIKNQNYLKYILVFLLIIISSLLLLRKSFVSLIPSIIDSSYAQSMDNTSKKKFKI